MKTSALFAMVSTLGILAGCGSDSSTTASTASTSTDTTSTSSASPPAKTAEAPTKTATTKLGHEELDSAYDAAVKGKMLDSFDTKKASLVKALGEPQHAVGDALYWYALRPATGTKSAGCKELMIGKDGSASLGGVAEDFCFGKKPEPKASTQAASSSETTSAAPTESASSTPAEGAGGLAELEGDYSWYSDSGSGGAKLKVKGDGFNINYNGAYAGVVSCKPSKTPDLFHCSYSDNSGSGSASFKKTKDLDLAGSWSDGSSGGGWTFKRVRK